MAFPEELRSIPHAFFPFNLRIQYIPSGVFFPEKVEQVAAILKYINEKELNQIVAARCGGHSYASYSLGGKDGAWVIDLRKFDEVEVHKDNTASIGAGNSVERVTTELYKNGKKTIPSGLCFSVGIGGLTLHGGYGFTSRMWGLNIDAVEEVEVVLANGEVVIATRDDEKDHKKDLFFAILGAGSSFGIVTKFKMKLEDAPNGIQYTLTWEKITKKKDRKSIFKGFQNFAKSNCPENMSVRLQIRQDKMVIMGVYWIQKSSEHNLDKLKEHILLLKKGIIPQVEPVYVPPADQNGKEYLDIAKLYPPLPRNAFFATSLFLKDELEDIYIDKLCEYIKKPDPPPPACHTWYINIDTLGGKDSKVPEGRNRQRSCVPFRNSLFIFRVSISTKTAETFNPEGIKFCHNLKNTLIASNSPPIMYYNFIDSEGKGDAGKYYEETTYQRLKQLKKKYDPKCIFWTPQCIGAEDCKERVKEVEDIEEADDTYVGL